MASCSASGPGRTWQKFSARTNSSSSIHFCRSTTCRCIRPIWPTGPPKASQPSLRKRSEEHTSELQSRLHLVCRLLLEKKKQDHPGPERCSHPLRDESDGGQVVLPGRPRPVSHDSDGGRREGEPGRHRHRPG